MKFSESTKNIFKALSEFKKDFKQPMKDADNPFFKSKYVPLENVVQAIDKEAPKHGLGYFQSPVTNEHGLAGVATVITHSSGEYIEFDPLYLRSDKPTAQGMGSAITYARRYSLSSAFGIASDVDDDGNEASGLEKGNSHQAEHANQGQIITEPTQGEALFRAKELKESIAKIREVSEAQVDEWVKDYFEVSSVSEIKDLNKLVRYLIRLEAQAKKKSKEATKSTE